MAVPRFNGVKIFSATMAQQRAEMSDHISRWIQENHSCEVADIVVTQSSDAAFHCIAVSIFYWQNAR